MVTYDLIKASNARIATTLPAGMVAVFAGATSGIGEFSLKAFARHAVRPRVYFVGRSRSAADLILSELRALNAGGEYSFIQADLGLVKNVDTVCEQIKKKEARINLLFLSQGALVIRDTAEGIPTTLALLYYSRVRFVVNLLPLVQAATGLRRCVFVLTGTKEGPVDTTDWFGRNVRNPLRARAHGATMVTLALARLARDVAPDVSFVHDYPGYVQTRFGRELNPVVAVVLGSLIRPFLGRTIPPEECGDTHMFFATSAAFPPANGDAAVAGVPLGEGVAARKGYDGRLGSGAYTIGEEGEPASDRVVELLRKMIKDGVMDELWRHTEAEFKRICG